MIPEATLVQANNGFADEETLLQEEENKDGMEAESFLYDNVHFDILSNAELFYQTYTRKEPKDFWTAFDIF